MAGSKAIQITPTPPLNKENSYKTTTKYGNQPKDKQIRSILSTISITIPPPIRKIIQKIHNQKITILNMYPKAHLLLLILLETLSVNHMTPFRLKQLDNLHTKMGLRYLKVELNIGNLIIKVVSIKIALFHLKVKDVKKNHHRFIKLIQEWSTKNYPKLFLIRIDHT